MANIMIMSNMSNNMPKKSSVQRCHKIVYNYKLSKADELLVQHIESYILPRYNLIERLHQQWERSCVNSYAIHRSLLHWNPLDFRQFIYEYSIAETPRRFAFQLRSMCCKIDKINKAESMMRSSVNQSLHPIENSLCNNVSDVAQTSTTLPFSTMLANSITQSSSSLNRFGISDSSNMNRDNSLKDSKSITDKSFIDDDDEFTSDCANSNVRNANVHHSRMQLLEQLFTDFKREVDELAYRNGSDILKYAEVFDYINFFFTDFVVV